MDILHPVGDGFSLGTLQIVGGNGDGVTRFEVLSPSRDDDANYVAIEFGQALGFDTFMQARAPIALGDGVMRGRFAVLEGNGGVELAVSLWRANPATQSDPDALIARTNNFTIWHTDFQEYALPLLGRACDEVAAFMGDLWLRVVVINAPGGVQMPTLGIGSIWLEVPEAADGISFVDPNVTPPPEATLVTVSMFSGRSAQAKSVAGEWRDASDAPFEHDKHGLPLGSDGELQAPRQVNGWGQ